MIPRPVEDPLATFGPILVINLPFRADRRSEFAAQLHRLGCPSIIRRSIFTLRLDRWRPKAFHPSMHEAAFSGILGFCVRRL